MDNLIIYLKAGSLVNVFSGSLLINDVRVAQNKKMCCSICQVPKPVAVSKPPPADMCYFCKTKVYIVERYTLRGILFHRNCLKCDYCGTVLRVTSYACQTMDSGECMYYHSICPKIDAKSL